MRIVQQTQDPVPLTIAEAEGCEEIFLSYRSAPGNYARGIERDGKGPPKVWWNDPPHYIFDAHAQRRGSWFIRSGDQSPDNAETERRRRGASGELGDDLDAMRRDVESDCHEFQFRVRSPEFQITGMQGSGDLTMNYWNVTYVNTGGVRELVFLENEDVWGRVYTCLVKWKARIGNGQVVSIEDVRFSRSVDGTPGVRVFWNGQWLPRGDEIDFAASNQRVIRDGEVVPALETCHQFGDIRHLLQTPNMNPAGALYPGEPRRRDGQFERTYFSQSPRAEVWLGEYEFIADSSRNLLRAALSGPVVFEWGLRSGASEPQVRGALTLARYREVAVPNRLLRPGEWRFTYGKSENSIAAIEIFFRRNRYGWTMLATSRDGRRLLGMACHGFPGDQRGHTLEEAATIFARAGAYNALLIDEGQDAFQIVGGVDQIERNRRRLRACFVFAKRDAQQKGGNSK
jgi:hypothetical protein